MAEDDDRIFQELRVEWVNRTGPFAKFALDPTEGQASAEAAAPAADDDQEEST